MAQIFINPGDVHPYYLEERFEWVRLWVDDKLPTIKQHSILIPVPRVLRWLDLQSSEPLEPAPVPTIMMHRRQFWGIAPYVGIPFVYVWNVGIDQYNRHVAGTEVRIVRDESKVFSHARRG